MTISVITLLTNICLYKLLVELFNLQLFLIQVDLIHV